jgi:hypothetical protein
LPYADTSNVFMYGFSRGGQNAYKHPWRWNSTRWPSRPEPPIG